MIVGLTLMSVSCLVFAFADTIGVLDAARFLQGVGGACSWAGGMAWVAGEAPRERRGALLGSAMGFAIFGVQLGPVVGAVARGVGQEVAFSSTVAVRPWRSASGRGRSRSAAPRARRSRRRPRRCATARCSPGMWLTALPAAAFGVLDVLAPLRLDALGASALALGLTFFAAAGVEAIVTPAVGRYTDRAGARTVVRGGLAATVAALVVLQLPATARRAGDRRDRRLRPARRPVGAGDGPAHGRRRADRARPRLRLRLLQPRVGGRLQPRRVRRRQPRRGHDATRSRTRASPSSTRSRRCTRCSAAAAAAASPRAASSCAAESARAAEATGAAVTVSRVTVCRARAGPRGLQRPVRPAAHARPPRGGRPARGRAGRRRRQLPRLPRGARRARPRRRHRVPRPDRRAARAEVAAHAAARGRRAARPRARARRPRSCSRGCSRRAATAGPPSTSPTGSARRTATASAPRRSRASCAARPPTT